LRVIKDEGEEVQVFQKIENVAVDVIEQSEVEGRKSHKEIIIIDENKVEDEEIKEIHNVNDLDEFDKQYHQQINMEEEYKGGKPAGNIDNNLNPSHDEHGIKDNIDEDIPDEHNAYPHDEHKVHNEHEEHIHDEHDNEQKRRLKLHLRESINVKENSITLENKIDVMTTM
jgi:hypothetical protein